MSFLHSSQSFSWLPGKVVKSKMADPIWRMFWRHVTSYDIIANKKHIILQSKLWIYWYSWETYIQDANLSSCQKTRTCKWTCKLQSAFQFHFFVAVNVIAGRVTIPCVNHIQIRAMVKHHPFKLFSDDGEWRPFSGFLLPTLSHQFIPGKKSGRCH